MAYSVQRVPGEPIVIDTHTEPADPAGFRAFAQELSDTIAAIEGPVFRIADLTGLSFSFPTLVHVLAEETRSGRPGSAGDPRVQLLLVATGDIADLIVQSAQQEQYGNLQLHLFSSVEAALAHARMLRDVLPD